MLNLRTAMPIIKLFNTTFYISVCNVEATLRFCKENTSKCVISVIAIVMLNKNQVVFLSLHRLNWKMDHYRNTQSKMPIFFGFCVISNN